MSFSKLEWVNLQFCYLLTWHIFRTFFYRYIIFAIYHEFISCCSCNKIGLAKKAFNLYVRVIKWFVHIGKYGKVDLINEHEMTVLLELWKSILTEICSSTFQIRQVSSFLKYTLELQGWITRVENFNLNMNWN